MAYKLKNIRVLVVDSNLPMRTLIRALLLDLGFGTVDIAPNAVKGFEMYQKNKPDIILVDWRIDQADGITFTKSIRLETRNQKSKIPIIMMTGFVSKDRVFTARDAGVTEFLIKPFTIQTLTSHLMHIIERPRDFVISKKFTGPDRRRRTADVDEKKRKHEAKKNEKYIDLRGGDKPSGKDTK